MIEDDQRFEETIMLNRNEKGGALPGNIISCPIWSPFDAFKAANALLAMLAAEEHDSQSKFKTI